jgi:excisionase family DNA binding protein
MLFYSLKKEGVREMEKREYKDLQGKAMLTKQEIAKYLGVSASWLSKMSSPAKVRECIPFRRIGKNYYFSVSEVEEWNARRRD